MARPIKATDTDVDRQPLGSGAYRIMGNQRSRARPRHIEGWRCDGAAVPFEALRNPNRPSGLLAQGTVDTGSS